MTGAEKITADSSAADPVGVSPAANPALGARGYNFAADVLKRNLDAGRAGKPAYIDVRGTWKYGQLADRVNRFGAALRGLGIRREERVLMAVLDTIDWPTAFLGCLKAGIIAVPVNTLLTEDDYRFMLADSRAKALIAGGMSASSIAVLYRINAQSEGYEQALAAEGVPYVVRGGERFFARADVRAALVELNKVARAEVARAPAAGDSDTGAAESGAADAAFDGETGLVPQVRAVLGRVGLTPTPPPPGALRDRWDALAALVSVAEELSAVDASATMTTFVAELAQRAQSQHAPSVDGVTLASLHAAKGLEWDAVFLVGLTDGTLPIQHADTPEAIEEERRLFYVGITRARSRLMLSWALARQEGGRRVRSRSRFLTGLVPSSGVRTAPGARGQRHKPGRCTGCGGPLATAAEIKAGRCQACPSTADPGLVAELKAWRKGRASDASVPAFVVFSDATLMAIAERRPCDRAALLAIPGIGRSKLDTYGSEVLSIVAGHAAS